MVPLGRVQIVLMCSLSVCLLIGFGAATIGAKGLDGAEGLACELAFDDPEVTVVLTGANQTPVSINGFFRLTEKSGVDALLETSATLSISRSDWSASLSRSSFSNIQEGEIYQFSVEVSIPAEAEDGSSCSYTVTLTVSDQLGSAQDQAVLTVKAEAPPDDDDDGGDDNTPLPQGDNSIPLWPIIFVLGILILGAIAGYWAYRNLEMVREVDGSKRIYLRERDSGRIIGKDGRSRRP